ncbi:U3 small nucleolar RNA-associated protein 6 [Cryptosporidium felis]|nr:U3 small nucleolar RNA-associated protein 6 [Cryptosporidium felis]
MADKVQRVMEDMVPELLDLGKRKVFSKEEIKEIVRRRRNFEYKIASRTPVLGDFLEYLNYEYELERLRNSRTRKLKLKKRSIGDYSIVRLIHFIFKRALRRFPSDEKLWLQNIDFCLKSGSSKALQRNLISALRHNPKNGVFWLIMSDRELQNGNPKEARSAILLGIRANKESLILWRGFSQLETNIAYRVYLDSFSCNDFSNKRKKKTVNPSVKPLIPILEHGLRRIEADQKKDSFLVFMFRQYNKIYRVLLSDGDFSRIEGMSELESQLFGLFESRRQFQPLFPAFTFVLRTYINQNSEVFLNLKSEMSHILNHADKEFTLVALIFICRLVFNCLNGKSTQYSSKDSSRCMLDGASNIVEFGFHISETADDLDPKIENLNNNQSSEDLQVSMVTWYSHTSPENLILKKDAHLKKVVKLLKLEPNLWRSCLLEDVGFDHLYEVLARYQASGIDEREIWKEQLFSEDEISSLRQRIGSYLANSSVKEEMLQFFSEVKEKVASFTLDKDSQTLKLLAMEALSSLFDSEVGKKDSFNEPPFFKEEKFQQLNDASTTIPQVIQTTKRFIVINGVNAMQLDQLKFLAHSINTLLDLIQQEVDNNLRASSNTDFVGFSKSILWTLYLINKNPVGSDCESSKYLLNLERRVILYSLNVIPSWLPNKSIPGFLFNLLLVYSILKTTTNSSNSTSDLVLKYLMEIETGANLRFENSPLLEILRESQNSSSLAQSTEILMELSANNKWILNNNEVVMMPGRSREVACITFMVALTSLNSILFEKVLSTAILGSGPPGSLKLDSKLDENCVFKLFWIWKLLSDFARQLKDSSEDHLSLLFDLRFLFVVKLVEYLRLKRILSPQTFHQTEPFKIPSVFEFMSQLKKSYPCHLITKNLHHGLSIAYFSSLPLQDPQFSTSLEKVCSRSLNDNEITLRAQDQPDGSYGQSSDKNSSFFEATVRSILDPTQLLALTSRRRTEKASEGSVELSNTDAHTNIGVKRAWGGLEARKEGRVWGVLGFTKEAQARYEGDWRRGVFWRGAGEKRMKEEEGFERREESISIQPRLYGFDSSWDDEILKLRQSGALKSPIIIDQAVRSGQVFYITLITGHIIRWFPDEITATLITLEPPVGLGGGKETFERGKHSQTPQLFVDHTGNHALIVQGGGETWYLHSTQSKARYIQKLSSYSILSVAWNTLESSRNSAASIIIGCRKGTILTTILGPDISPSSAVIRVLYEVSGSSILGVMIDSQKVETLDTSSDEDSETPFNKLQYAVVVSTQTRLLLWHGQSRIIDLFLKSEESPGSSRSCIEIGTTEAFSLSSKIRLLEVSNLRFLIWMNSEGIFIYSLNNTARRSPPEQQDFYVGNLSKYLFSKGTNGRVPNSIECSRFHIILLLEEYLDVISPITARSVYRVSLGSFPGQAHGLGSAAPSAEKDLQGRTAPTIKALAVELSSSFNNLAALKGSSSSGAREEELLDRISFIWGYSDENIYKINIVNEGETLWRESLYLGRFEESLAFTEKIHSTTSRSRKRHLTRKLQFLDLIRRGKVKHAAQLLSVIDDELSFNEICTTFISYSCWDGLAAFLTCKLQQLKTNHKDQITAGTPYQDETIILKFVVLSIWLVELNSFLSFSRGETSVQEEYYSGLISVLRQISQVDEVEARIYGILAQYNRRTAIHLYSDLRRDWHVLVQECISFGILDPSLVKKCFEIFVSIEGNVSKRDKLLVQYSPILGTLDPKRLLSLLKRPSFSSVDLNLVLASLLELGHPEHRGSEKEREELDKLSILLIESYFNISARSGARSQMERVSTRFRLQMHTDSWKANRTIWNVLAILCSRLEEGEELLLSYVTPLLGDARKESQSSTDLGFDSRLEMKFDLPFLLSICKTNRYLKLMAYVYCLLGLYDSAMSVCLKDLNNTRLTKDIIYNFIESFQQRRKWILSLIRPLGHNRDIAGLTKLLSASPKYMLTLSDVLTVLPEDVGLSFLSNVISSNVNQFDDLLLKRTKVYGNYKQTRDSLLTDIFSSHTSFSILDPQRDICLVCYRSLLGFPGLSFQEVRDLSHSLRISSLDQVQFNSFTQNFLSKCEERPSDTDPKSDGLADIVGTDCYKFLNEDLNSDIMVFPCSHSFHFGCVLLKFASLMSHEEAGKMKRIVEGICRHSALYLRGRGKRSKPGGRSENTGLNAASRAFLDYKRPNTGKDKSKIKSSYSSKGRENTGRKLNWALLANRSKGAEMDGNSGASTLSSLYKQLIGLVNRDCLICGELMIRNIDKPFIADEDEEDENDFCIG